MTLYLDHRAVAEQHRARDALIEFREHTARTRHVFVVPVSRYQSSASRSPSSRSSCAKIFASTSLTGVEAETDGAPSSRSSGARPLASIRLTGVRAVTPGNP